MKIRGWMFLAVILGWAMADAAGARTPQVTLLVVPARYDVIQVSFDIAQRVPVVVLAYQGDSTTENPVLHAWNGTEWVYISLEDFRNGQFLAVTPERTIFVGGSDLLPQTLLVAAGGWCPKVLTVPHIARADMINALGQLLEFSRADWEWIAGRYRMTLRDLNQERRRESWFDQRGYRDEWTDRLREWPMRRARRGYPPPAPRPSEPTPAPAPVVLPPTGPIEVREAPPPPPAPAQPLPAVTPPPAWEEKAIDAGEMPVK